MEKKSFSGKWLITGGLGFIGVQLIRHLCAQDGVYIKILDNHLTGTKDDLETFIKDKKKATYSDTLDAWPEDADTIHILKSDIRDFEHVKLAVTDADYVVHLAANTGVQPSVDNPKFDMENNIVGTFNLLEAIRTQFAGKTPPQFVFASSNAPLGAVKLPANELSSVKPLSPYGASKLAGEGYISAYANSFNVPGVGLRFGNVYGPGSGHKSSVVAKFIRQALNGETLEIYGDGNQSRDFIFIEDLVNAIIKAALTPDIGGELFQISPGQETRVIDIAKTICDMVVKQGLNMPELIYTETRVGDMQKNYSDVAKAKKYLDWSATTNLQDGLEKTFEWFVDTINS